MSFFKEFVELGGLMSYGANLADMFYRAADYVQLRSSKEMAFEKAVTAKEVYQITSLVAGSFIVDGYKMHRIFPVLDATLRHFNDAFGDDLAHRT